MQESLNVATYYNYFLQNTRYKSYITKNNFSTNAFVIHKMLPTNNKLGIVAITTKLKKKKKRHYDKRKGGPEHGRNHREQKW